MQDGKSFLPWYNFPLIEFLNSYIKPNMNIFEYGCGYSTLFYAQKDCNVYSVETKKEWIEKIQTLAIKNNLYHKIHITQSNPHKFPQMIHQYEINFDIIIIDSYHRLSCLTEAKMKNSNSIIILDNSERENLQKADIIMQEFQCKIFEGNGVNRETSSQAKVFYRKILNI